MSYLKSLQREYTSLQSTIERNKEKIHLYHREIKKDENKLEELSEVIAHVAQLSRYKESE